MKKMKLRIPPILLPAMGLNLDTKIVVEVEWNMGRELIDKGWIPIDD